MSVLLSLIDGTMGSSRRSVSVHNSFLNQSLFLTLFLSSFSLVTALSSSVCHRLITVTQRCSCPSMGCPQTQPSPPSMNALQPWFPQCPFPFFYSVLSLHKCLLRVLLTCPCFVCPPVSPLTSSYAFSHVSSHVSFYILCCVSSEVPSGLSCPGDKHPFLSMSTQSCHRLPACLYFWWALGFLTI